MQHHKPKAPKVGGFHSTSFSKSRSLKFRKILYNITNILYNIKFVNSIYLKFCKNEIIQILKVPIYTFLNQETFLLDHNCRTELV